MRKAAVLLLFLCGLILTAGDRFWEKAETVQRGTLLRRIERTEPRLMKICMMRIDLTQPGLTFTATPRDADWGKPMPDYPALTIATDRVKTRDFMLAERAAGKNMIVAANSAPWEPWVRPFNHRYGNPLGIMILDGELITDRKPTGAEFVVWKNGKIDITDTIAPEDYSKVKVAAGGFALIMLKGEILPGGGYEKPLMPRIAYGLSRDRKYMYIITVDGRQPEWSLGATGRELAEMLKEAGAYDAINMDGGGSATLCYWDRQKKEPVTVTHQPKNVERNVGANLGIYLK